MHPTAVPRLRRILLPLAALPLLAALRTALPRDAAPTASAASPRGAAALVRLRVATPERRGAPASPAVPTVTIVDLNSGPHVDRVQCLTASAGPGAAFECGDLRLVHGAPGVRVRGRARAPVLLYNSKYAHPRQTVYADVALPAGATVPDSVIVTMTRPDGTVLWRNGFRGIDWVPGGPPRRVAAQWDATGTGGTRIDGYAWQVSTLYAGALYSTPLIHAPIAVVDRSASPYGAGWWVAGLEELKYVSSVRWLWVGGDGSTRLYRNTGTPGVFSVDSISRPDTLRAVAVGAETHYYRTLPGGAKIWFNALGQHYRTENRLGEATTFAYSGTRLSSITYASSPGGPVSAHYFNYDALGRLASVTGPSAGTAARILTLSYGLGDGRVTAMTDSDGHAVQFGYASASPALVTSRTDRRGTVVGFGYDHAWKLTAVNVPLATGDTLVSRIFSTEMRGLRGNSVPVDHAYTWFNGPRTDVNDYTSIWLTRWGAPQRILDAAGGETVLTRADPILRALVTQVAAPSGLVSRAWYNARGNVDSTAVVNPLADGRDAVTRYQYDAVWRDFMTQVTEPEGEVTLVAYDPATGNRTWEQKGTDPARRMTYDYWTDPYAAGSAVGHVKSVTYPAVNGQAAVEQYEYDAMGNLRATVSPLQFRTEFASDNLGRVVSVRSPVSAGVYQYDSTFYDLADRVDSTVTRGGTQRVVVNNVQDAEGNLTSVSRRSVPDTAAIGTITTQWVYDRANRRVVEVAPDGMRDSTVYDAAGNAVEVHTRRTDDTGTRLVVRMQYDAMNRLLRRITPPVQYNARDEGLAARGFIVGWEGGSASDQPPPYPWYPNDGGTGYRVPGDTAVYQYDVAGRMTVADNRDARIRRAYYPGGALRGDTLIVRTWEELASGGSFSHVYGLEFRYDRNGRRTELKHPSTIAPLVGGVPYDRTYQSFDPQTGALAQVVDPLGTTFRYHYNARGEVDSLYLPGGITESYRYDLDGRLVLHQTANASTSADRYLPNPLRRDTLGYDQRAKLLFSRNGAGAADTLTAQYSVLGHLTSTRVKSSGARLNGAVPSSTTQEGPRYDALGNQVFRSTSSTFRLAKYGSTTSSSETYRYQPGTGRLRAKQTPVHGDTLVYDAAGNHVWETYTTPGYTSSDDFRDRAYFYDAANQLRASDTRTVDDPSNQLSYYTRAFEDYRYDALGRRVLVRARRDCKQASWSGACELGWLRRIVWDGDQELYEIQAPGGQEPYYWQHMENDTAHIPLAAITYEGNPVDPNPFYGRVLYTHGVSLDHPLGVVRMGYGDLLDTANAVRAYRKLDPYVIVPHWNSRGQPVLGTYADGAWRRCQLVSGYKRCNFLQWPEMWAGYARADVRDNAWHGSLLRDKGDGSGLNYRRNRYYDPGTGRFTQEDPIGIAGGLNVYGFAAGDPVNYADPYGLCPMRLTGRPCGSPLEKRPLSLRGTASGEWNPRVGEFGMTRSGGRQAHHGVDILADVGTPVTAVDEGRVVFAGEAGGYGNTVILGHANDNGEIVSYTVYAHLSTIEQGIQAGATVESGESVGAVGQSGNAGGTPPHLHFEIRTKRYPAGGEPGLKDRVNPKDEMDLDGGGE